MKHNHSSILNNMENKRFQKCTIIPGVRKIKKSIVHSGIFLFKNPLSYLSNYHHVNILLSQSLLKKTIGISNQIAVQTCVSRKQNANRLLIFLKQTLKGSRRVFHMS